MRCTPLGRLQRQLERTYEVHVPQAVTDFVITDDQFVQQIEGIGARASPEKLLLVEDADEHTVDIGLYLDQAVVDALACDNPLEHLHVGNLETFCTALEGVSHFLYLLWNAGYERPVSLMELELQAEVDKYITASFLFANQSGRVPSELGRRMFCDQSYDDALSARSRERYEAANYYAGRYCQQIESHYLRDRSKGGLVNELRRFYRLTRQQKLRHIEAGLKH